MGSPRDAFRSLHAGHYGYAMIDEPMIVVNAKVTVVGRVPKPSMSSAPVPQSPDQVHSVPRAVQPPSAYHVWPVT